MEGDIAAAGRIRSSARPPVVSGSPPAIQFARFGVVDDATPGILSPSTGVQTPRCCRRVGKRSRTRQVTSPRRVLVCSVAVRTAATCQEGIRPLHRVSNAVNRTSVVVTDLGATLNGRSCAVTAYRVATGRKRDWPVVVRCIAAAAVADSPRCSVLTPVPEALTAGEPLRGQRTARHFARTVRGQHLFSACVVESVSVRVSRGRLFRRTSRRSQARPARAGALALRTGIVEAQWPRQACRIMLGCCQRMCLPRGRGLAGSVQTVDCCHPGGQFLPAELNADLGVMAVRPGRNPRDGGQTSEPRPHRHGSKTPNRRGFDMKSLDL